MKRLVLTSLLLLAATTHFGAWAQGRSIPKGSEAKAQEAVAEIVDELPEGQKYRYPLLNGLNISVDIFDPLMRLTLFDHASYEAQAMLDLHHRFFPMASFGMGEANEVSNNGLDYDFPDKQKRECSFKSKLSPFGKVGIGYNLGFNDLRPDDFYMLMLRYGVAYSKADISNLYYAESFWGATGPITIAEQKYTTQWLELGGMIKVQIMSHLSLGWDLYVKVKVAQSGTRQGIPYFVPGYGTSSSPVGFSFRIYYDLF